MGKLYFTDIKYTKEYELYIVCSGGQIEYKTEDADLATAYCANKYASDFRHACSSCEVEDSDLEPDTVAEMRLQAQMDGDNCYYTSVQFTVFNGTNKEALVEIFDYEYEESADKVAGLEQVVGLDDTFTTSNYDTFTYSDVLNAPDLPYDDDDDYDEDDYYDDDDDDYDEDDYFEDDDDEDDDDDDEDTSKYGMFAYVDKLDAPDLSCDGTSDYGMFAYVDKLGAPDLSCGNDNEQGEETK